MMKNSHLIVCNASFQDVADTIVLINRGNCDFYIKAYHAAAAGALGYIFSNVIDNLLPIPSYAAGKDKNLVNIPGLLIHGDHGNMIRRLLENDVPVRVSLRGPLMCPPNRLG
jgi:hypothetical protein